MTNRDYGQFCGLAHALEMVGERWALLIVRDLLVGPKRYSDLRRGLPRIPTNILAARLRKLEETGVVHRRVLPRPDGSVVYELTPYGRDLEEVVLTLGRWGARTMDEPGPDDIVTTDSLVMAMRSMFRGEAADGGRLGFELRFGGDPGTEQVVVHALVAGGAAEIATGPLPDADLVIEISAAFTALMSGGLSPADAVAGGQVRLSGDPALLDRFVELFSIPGAREPIGH
jgi:DNA-binding HxlR family transcriptional regulator/putative sterol carrier protein